MGGAVVTGTEGLQRDGGRRSDPVRQRIGLIGRHAQRDFAADRVGGERAVIITTVGGRRIRIRAGADEAADGVGGQRLGVGRDRRSRTEQVVAVGQTARGFLPAQFDATGGALHGRQTGGRRWHGIVIGHANRGRSDAGGRIAIFGGGGEIVLAGDQGDRQREGSVGTCRGRADAGTATIESNQGVGLGRAAHGQRLAVHLGVVRGRSDRRDGRRGQRHGKRNAQDDGRRVGVVPRLDCERAGTVCRWLDCKRSGEPVGRDGVAGQQDTVQVKIDPLHARGVGGRDTERAIRSYRCSHGAAIERRVRQDRRQVIEIVMGDQDTALQNTIRIGTGLEGGGLADGQRTGIERRSIRGITTIQRIMETGAGNRKSGRQ